MSEYKAIISWQRDGAVFSGQKYSRSHLWAFDGGLEIPASSSPQVVPLPYSDAGAIDPEEAFIASLSSCHMLWFLSIAAGKGFVVDSYRDAATGKMGKNDDGRLAMIQVILHPEVDFSGANRPSDSQRSAMHDEAHERCFIANSVKTEVRCEPVKDPTERD